MKKIRFILTPCVSIALASAMALPAFAQGYGVRGTRDGTYAYTLNINGAVGSEYTNRSLNIWYVSSLAGSEDQNFEFRSAGNNMWYMCPAHHTDYAINRASSSGKAIIWPVSSGHDDSILYQRVYNGAAYCEFELANPVYSGQRLSVSSNLYNWSPCYFKTITSGWSYQWEPLYG